MADFDAKSQEYDAWYETPLGAFVDARECECAFYLLPPDLGKNVMDAGCGTGRFSLKMAMLGHSVTGIDLSEPMLEIARKKAEQTNKEIKFNRMDLCDLEFEDESFDAVVSMALFEFIHDDQKALSECFRVVKPGGYIMIGTITKDSAWGREYESHMFKEDSVFKNASFKTREEMRSLFPEHLVAWRECVFTAPSASPEELTLEREAKLSETDAGGFICLLWQKPLA